MSNLNIICFLIFIDTDATMLCYSYTKIAIANLIGNAESLTAKKK